MLCTNFVAAIAAMSFVVAAVAALQWGVVQMLNKRRRVGEAVAAMGTVQIFEQLLGKCSCNGRCTNVVVAVAAQQRGVGQILNKRTRV